MSEEFMTQGGRPRVVGIETGKFPKWVLGIYLAMLIASPHKVPEKSQGKEGPVLEETHVKRRLRPRASPCRPSPRNCSSCCGYTQRRTRKDLTPGPGQRGDSQLGGRSSEDAEAELVVNRFSPVPETGRVQLTCPPSGQEMSLACRSPWDFSTTGKSHSPYQQ